MGRWIWLKLDHLTIVPHRVSHPTKQIVFWKLRILPIYRLTFNTWSSRAVPKVSNRPVPFSKRLVKIPVPGIMCSLPPHWWNIIAAKIKTLRFVFSNWAWNDLAAVRSMSCAMWTTCRIWMVMSLLNTQIAAQYHANFPFLITEDNNTRVLFERVLSSGGLTAQLSVEVWNKFMEFESNIGDLSSIVKVERRRSAVLENVRIAHSPPQHCS